LLSTRARRDFIKGIWGTVLWPLVARAQSQKTLRIGMVSVLPRNETPPYSAFLKRLRQLGYDEGQNLAFEYVKVPSADE
jgi:putative ABC transport system substrate-binding protein